MRRAGILARTRRAALTLLSVVDDDQPAALVESERRQVAALLAELAATVAELQGMTPELIVEPGDPFDTILRFADAHDVDLIVMGEHRRRLLRDIIVGTTVERVMRLGRHPVLTANAPAECPYRRVLAAVDLAEEGAPALPASSRLGLLDGAALTLFRAFTPLAQSALVVGDAGRRELERQGAEEGARTREALAPARRGAGPRVMRDRGTADARVRGARRRRGGDASRPRGDGNAGAWAPGAGDARKRGRAGAMPLHQRRAVGAGAVTWRTATAPIHIGP